MPAAKANQVYNLFILGLSIYVLVALAVDTFFALDPEVSTILWVVDFGVCILFLFDFFVSFITAKSKLAYMKWGWIDLISSIPMVEQIRWGRAARMIRILRLLRGLKSTKVLMGHILKNRAQATFLSACMTCLLLVVFGSISVLHFERGVNSNINNAEDALWWAYVTVTTVGYGDFYPVTTGGRIVAAVLMLGGIGLFGTFSGFVAAWFLERDDANTGDAAHAAQEPTKGQESEAPTMD